MLFTNVLKEQPLEREKGGSTAYHMVQRENTALYKSEESASSVLFQNQSSSIHYLSTHPIAIVYPNLRGKNTQQQLKHCLLPIYPKPRPLEPLSTIYYLYLLSIAHAAQTDTNLSSSIEIASKTKHE
jgi:hypothetical protein